MLQGKVSIPLKGANAPGLGVFEEDIRQKLINEGHLHTNTAQKFTTAEKSLERRVDITIVNIYISGTDKSTLVHEVNS